MPATPAETIRVDDRDVIVTNPGKVLFPQSGHTKLDVVRYYLSVAEGALRGSGGRPNVLVRYPDGIDAEFFFQKRAPQDRPPWVEVVTIRFPSGRTAEEVVPRHAADLAWMANLACLELHPHPVRAEDLDHPDELRIDLDPVAGVAWSQVREVARVVRRGLEDHGLVRLAEDIGQARHCMCSSASSADGRIDQVRRAALALAREVEQRVPTLATSKWWKEERHGVFIDYNQNAKDRTVAGAYSIRPTPDARVSAPLDWSEVDDVRPGGFHDGHDAEALRNARRPAPRHRRAIVTRSTVCSSFRSNRNATAWAMRRGRRNMRRLRASLSACSRRERGCAWCGATAARLSAPPRVLPPAQLQR